MFLNIAFLQAFKMKRLGMTLGFALGYLDCDYQSSNQDYFFLSP